MPFHSQGGVSQYVGSLVTQAYDAYCAEGHTDILYSCGQLNLGSADAQRWGYLNYEDVPLFAGFQVQMIDAAYLYNHSDEVGRLAEWIIGYKNGQTPWYSTTGQGTIAGWQQHTLTAVAGAPQPASATPAFSGAPSAYVTPDGTGRVVYQDVNSNITEMYLGLGQGWQHDTLTAAGAPQAAANSVPFGYVTPDGAARVVYQDVNGNITEMYLVPGRQGWVQDTLSAAAGAPHAASDPVGYVTQDGTARVVYKDVNSNITEIRLPRGGNWAQESLNSVTGAPQADGAPFGYVTSDGTARVVYKDVNSNITEIRLPPGGNWAQESLNSVTGAPQADGAPVGYVTPDGTARVVYQDVNSNITEMYLAPNG